MQLVRTLVDCDKQGTDSALPKELRELYDGNLHFSASPAARPLVIANFVSTLDGVVSYEIEGKAGGSTISGSNLADKFIMGLLRASVDAVMVGAGTLHDVSAEVPAGATCIWGPSGAGKSTLLRLLNRLADPESGRGPLQGLNDLADLVADHPVDSGTFLRGLTIGALVGAAVAGLSIWRRVHRDDDTPEGPPNR